MLIALIMYQNDDDNGSEEWSGLYVFLLVAGSMLFVALVLVLTKQTWMRSVVLPDLGNSFIAYNFSDYSAAIIDREYCNIIIL